MQTIKPTFENLPLLVAEMCDRLERVEIALMKSNSQQPPSDLMTIQDVSEMLGLSIATLYSKVSRKEISSMKRGNRLYFSRKEITDSISAGRRATSQEIGQAAILQAAEAMQRGGNK